MHSIFHCLNSKAIADVIDASKNIYSFISPGITSEIAASIIRFHENNPSGQIDIIIDNSSEAIRHGYGLLECIEQLLERRIGVKYQTGIRIGMLSTDIASYVFNPAPQVIAEEPNDNTAPNAICISKHEADNILKSIKNSDDTHAEIDQIEIGKEFLKQEHIKRIQQDFEERPFIKPDLYRQMNVISSIFQLVETHLTGARLQARTFTLTPQDLGIKDTELANRIRASYTIIDKAEIMEITELESMHKNIKDAYFIQIQKYGNIIMHDRIKEFLDSIESLKNGIKVKQESLIKLIEEKLENSKTTLIPLIIQNLFSLNEYDLKKIVFPFSSDKEGVKKFVIQKLDKKFPKAEQILSKIDLTVKITNVSQYLIEQEEFKTKVSEAFNKPFNDIITIGPMAKIKNDDLDLSSL